MTSGEMPRGLLVTRRDSLRVAEHVVGVDRRLYANEPVVLPHEVPSHRFFFLTRRIARAFARLVLKIQKFA